MEPFIVVGRQIAIHHRPIFVLSYILDRAIWQYLDIELSLPNSPDDHDASAWHRTDVWHRGAFRVTGHEQVFRPLHGDWLQGGTAVTVPVRLQLRQAVDHVERLGQCRARTVLIIINYMHKSILRAHGWMQTTQVLHGLVCQG